MRDCMLRSCLVACALVSCQGAAPTPVPESPLPATPPPASAATRVETPILDATLENAWRAEIAGNQPQADDLFSRWASSLPEPTDRDFQISMQGADFTGDEREIVIRMTDGLLFARSDGTKVTALVPLPKADRSGILIETTKGSPLVSVFVDRMLDVVDAGKHVKVASFENVQGSDEYALFGHDVFLLRGNLVEVWNGGARRDSIALEGFDRDGLERMEALDASLVQFWFEEFSQVWDLKSKSKIYQGGAAVVLSPDGSHFAAARKTGVALYDRRGSRLAETSICNPRDYAFSPDGSKLAIGDKLHACVVSVPDLKKVFVTPAVKNSTNRILDVAAMFSPSFSRDSRILYLQGQSIPSAAYEIGNSTPTWSGVGKLFWRDEHTVVIADEDNEKLVTLRDGKEVAGRDVPRAELSTGKVQELGGHGVHLRGTAIARFRELTCELRGRLVPKRSCGTLSAQPIPN